MNTIQLLNRSEFSSIKTLLHSVNLPGSDLESAPIHFFGIKENNELIATSALEICGSNAILRSIAIHPDFQKSGYGKQIVKFLEKRAIELGINKFFLLTTTAETFFKKLEYQPVKRESCPDEIISSAPFRGICPSTATCLFKNLPVNRA